MAIQWSDDLAVGYTMIDEQHKALFKAVNDLSDAMWDGKGREEVARIVAFLGDYVIEHFGAEEKLMAKHDYPQYEQHRRQHIAFLQDFSSFKTRFDAGDVTTELVIKILDQTCDWLRVHIKQVDKALGSFLQAN
ncbi:MAG TPA: bacteriohemerythrin [Desulfomonilaceae bacterium]|nr:bacteriohemerythrin [Desulfomonilaceae bacterium]